MYTLKEIKLFKQISLLKKMVGVGSLNEGENSLRTKESKLRQITGETLGPQGKLRIVDPSGAREFSLKQGSIEVPNQPIVVFVDLNIIGVYYRSYHDEARRLSDAYEKATGEKFIIWKMY